MDVAELFDAHYGAVVAHARRRGMSFDEAHDVAADVFAVAVRRAADIPLGVERAWLLGVARRIEANRWRGQRRQRALLERLTGARTGPDLDVDGLAHTDPGLARALSALSTADREVLRLVAWDGLTLAEVGVALGCSETAATSRVARARQRLRRALDAQDEPALRGR